MGKEIKLKHWYFKVFESPKFDNCQYKSTDLFYAVEYHQYKMYSEYSVSFIESDNIGDYKKHTQTCMNDNKTISTNSLIEYEPISYEKAREYIDNFTNQYFNLCNQK